MRKIGELKYGVNAIRALLKETGKTPAQILEGGFDPRDMEFGVALVWAGMLWQDKSLTVEKVGDMLDAEEGLYFTSVTKAVNGLVTSFKRSFGIKDEVEVEPEAEEPGKN